MIKIIPQYLKIKDDSVIIKNDDPKLTELYKLHGWSHFYGFNNEKNLFSFTFNDLVLLNIKITRDIFNSNLLHFEQAKVNYQINQTFIWDDFILNELSSVLNKFIKGLQFKLFNLKIIGNSPIEILLFQKAGFNLVLGNSMFLLAKTNHINPINLDKSLYDIEIIDLKFNKLDNSLISQLLFIAKNSFFEDRFFLDVNISRQQAELRFLKIVENALKGEIADYIVLNRNKTNIISYIFFGISNKYAGKWFTSISQPNNVSKGLNILALYNAIDYFRENKIKWTFTCLNTNLATINASMHLGFKPVAISYDFHFWNKN